MKIGIATALLLIFGSIAVGQDHLVPDAGVLVDPDEYMLMIRHVLSPAFDDGVILRVVVLPSFRKEYVVGLRSTKAGFEAFRAEATSKIYDVVRLKEYEAGGGIQEMGDDGRPVSLDNNRFFQDLKKRTPADYRRIKIVEHHRPLSESLCKDAWAIWRAMLLGVRHPEGLTRVKDGLTRHYSTFVLGHGELSGHLRNDGTGDAFVLSKLSMKLDDFASGKCDQDALTKEVAVAETVIKPRPARPEEWRLFRDQD